MKKLLKKVLTAKKNKVLIHDPIEELITRLCDPTDVLYDENFVKGMNELNENSKLR